MTVIAAHTRTLKMMWSLMHLICLTLGIGGVENNVNCIMRIQFFNQGSPNINNLFALFALFSLAFDLFNQIKALPIRRIPHRLLLTKVK